MSTNIQIANLQITSLSAAKLQGAFDISWELVQGTPHAYQIYRYVSGYPPTYFGTPSFNESTFTLLSSVGIGTTTVRDTLSGIEPETLDQIYESKVQIWYAVYPYGVSEVSDAIDLFNKTPVIVYSCMGNYWGPWYGHISLFLWSYNGCSVDGCGKGHWKNRINSNDRYKFTNWNVARSTKSQVYNNMLYYEGDMIWAKKMDGSDYHTNVDLSRVAVDYISHKNEGKAFVWSADRGFLGQVFNQDLTDGLLVASKAQNVKHVSDGVHGLAVSPFTGDAYVGGISRVLKKVKHEDGPNKTGVSVAANKPTNMSYSLGTNFGMIPLKGYPYAYLSVETGAGLVMYNIDSRSLSAWCDTQSGHYQNVMCRHTDRWSRFNDWYPAKGTSKFVANIPSIWGVTQGIDGTVFTTSMLSTEYWNVSTQLSATAVRPRWKPYVWRSHHFDGYPYYYGYSYYGYYWGYPYYSGRSYYYYYRYAQYSPRFCCTDLSDAYMDGDQNALTGYRVWQTAEPKPGPERVSQRPPYPAPSEWSYAGLLTQKTWDGTALSSPVNYRFIPTTHTLSAWGLPYYWRGRGIWYWHRNWYLHYNHAFYYNHWAPLGNEDGIISIGADSENSIWCLGESPLIYKIYQMAPSATAPGPDSDYYYTRNGLARYKPGKPDDMTYIQYFLTRDPDLMSTAAALAWHANIQEGPVELDPTFGYDKKTDAPDEDNPIKTDSPFFPVDSWPGYEGNTIRGWYYEPSFTHRYHYFHHHYYFYYGKDRVSNLICYYDNLFKPAWNQYCTCQFTRPDTRHWIGGKRIKTGNAAYDNFYPFRDGAINTMEQVAKTWCDTYDPLFTCNGIRIYPQYAAAAFGDPDTPAANRSYYRVNGQFSDGKYYTSFKKYFETSYCPSDFTGMQMLQVESGMTHMVSGRLPGVVDHPIPTYPTLAGGSFGLLISSVRSYSSLLPESAWNPQTVTAINAVTGYDDLECTFIANTNTGTFDVTGWQFSFGDRAQDTIPVGHQNNAPSGIQGVNWAVYRYDDPTLNGRASSGWSDAYPGITGGSYFATVTAYANADCYTNSAVVVTDATQSITVLERYPKIEINLEPYTLVPGTVSAIGEEYSESRTIIGPEPLTALVSIRSTGRTWPVSAWIVDWGDGTQTTRYAADSTESPQDAITTFTNVLTVVYGWPPRTYFVAASSVAWFGTWSDLFGASGSGLRVQVSENPPEAGFFALCALTVPNDYSDDFPLYGPLSSNLPPCAVDVSGPIISGYSPNLTIWFMDTSTPHSFPISSYQWDFGDYYDETGNTAILIAPSGPTGSYPTWLTSMTNHVTSHTYVMPGVYTVTLYVNASTTSTQDSYSQTNSAMEFSVYVEEIPPSACVGLTSSYSVDVGDYSTTTIAGSSPLTIYFNTSCTLAGSFPICRLDFDFGDGSTIQTITRIPAVTSIMDGVSSVALTSLNYSHYVADPRNYVARHTYSTNSYSTTSFTVSMSAYACNTNTVDVVTLSNVVGPVVPEFTGLDPDDPSSNPDTNPFSEDRHLISTRMADGDLFMVFEGETKGTTYTVVLSGGV